jgi:hypothetical protein
MQFAYDFWPPKKIQSSDQWVRHELGDDSPSDVGGAALDVNGDGRIDFVTGGAWYESPEDILVHARLVLTASRREVIRSS